MWRCAGSNGASRAAKSRIPGPTAGTAAGTSRRRRHSPGWSPACAPRPRGPGPSWRRMTWLRPASPASGGTAPTRPRWSGSCSTCCRSTPATSGISTSPANSPAARPANKHSAASPPLAGLVVTGGLAGDGVHAVVDVDEGDERDQRRELVIVVMLRRVSPGLLGDTRGGIGDAGALLGEGQGGPLGLGEDGGLPPHRDEVEPQLGFPGVRGILGVHVGAVGAAVDLAGPDLHQLLRRGWQG